MKLSYDMPMKSVNKKISPSAVKLRELREEAHISMKEMALAMGFAGVSSYQHYETGYTRDGYPSWFITNLINILTQRGISLERIEELRESNTRPSRPEPRRKVTTAAKSKTAEPTHAEQIKKLKEKILTRVSPNELIQTVLKVQEEAMVAGVILNNSEVEQVAIKSLMAALATESHSVSSHLIQHFLEEKKVNEDA